MSEYALTYEQVVARIQLGETGTLPIAGGTPHTAVVRDRPPQAHL
jgi:hypothetical protein